MTVQDLHNAVDTICDYWPKAVLDARPYTLRARAYDAPTVTTSGHADPVGDGVASQGHAVAWLAELHDVAMMFIERMPDNPEGLRAIWHRLINDHPTGWAEAAVRRLYALADDGLRWWPAAAKAGEQVGDIMVGDGRVSVNDTKLCALCEATLITGKRRFVPDANGGGDWVCTTPCWYTLTTSRGVHPRQSAS